MKPIFSIITPTYNRGYVIWKAIQSVQRQTYPYWEHIIVDDGSTDDTKRVVAEFQKDPRVFYFLKEHQGAAAARNYGLEHTKGTIITYLDSDDSVYENFFTVALEFFQKHPKKVFAFPDYNRRLELYDKDYKLIEFARMSSSQKIELSLQDIYHWTVKAAYGTGLLHRDIILKDGIRWDTTMQRLEDWDFIMQIGEKYPDGFMHIPYVLFEYIQKYGSDSLCSNATYQDWANGFETVYKKHRNDPLLKGQNWYPRLVEKYIKLQKEFDRGNVPPQKYKYFPQYFSKKKSLPNS